MSRKKIIQILILLLVVSATGIGTVDAKQSGKDKLNILSMTITPKIAVPNDTINVVVVYQLNGIDLSGLDVSERKTLIVDNKDRLLEKRNVQRTNGTWQIKTTFLIPLSAPVGKYEVQQVVSSKIFSKSIQEAFVVQSATQLSEKKLKQAAIYTQKLKKEMEAKMKEVVAAKKDKTEKKQGEQKRIESGKVVRMEQNENKPKTLSVVEEKSVNEVKMAGEERKIEATGVATESLLKPDKTEERIYQNAEIQLFEKRDLEEPVGIQIHSHSGEKAIADKQERLKVSEPINVLSQEKEEKQSEQVVGETWLENKQSQTVSTSRMEPEPKKEVIEAKTIAMDRVEMRGKEKKAPVQEKIFKEPPLYLVNKGPVPIQVQAEEQAFVPKKVEQVVKIETDKSETNQYEPKVNRESEKEEVLNNRNLTDPRISKLAKREKMKSGGYGPWMIGFPLGSFSMGGDRYNEKPVHSVNIENEFSIMAQEVTIDLYQQYRKSVHKDSVKGIRAWGGEYPVTNISWNEAAGFGVWLSENTGHTYRLPTEAEWEYVAKYCNRSPEKQENVVFQNMVGLPEDEESEDQQLETVFNSTSDLCKIYGLKGNVWEWTQDCWADQYSPEHTNQKAYSYANCGNRVVRGGSYLEEKQRQTVTVRMGIYQKTKVPSIGFRLVREGLL